jgi:hypothetical protein
MLHGSTLRASKNINLEHGLGAHFYIIIQYVTLYLYIAHDFSFMSGDMFAPHQINLLCLYAVLRCTARCIFGADTRAYGTAVIISKLILNNRSSNAKGRTNLQMRFYHRRLFD